METEIMIWEALGSAVLWGGIVASVLMALLISITFVALVYPLIINWFHWVKRRFEYEYIKKANE